MPRNNNIICRAKGRLNKVSSVMSGTRDICKCTVDSCEFTKRGDKVRLHQQEQVLWGKDGLPASKNQPEYSNLSEDRRRKKQIFSMAIGTQALNFQN